MVDIKFDFKMPVKMANSEDPAQTAPEQSDLGLHCLPKAFMFLIFLTFTLIKISMLKKKYLSQLVGGV